MLPKRAFNGECFAGDFPDWQLVYYYHSTWSKNGVVKQIHDSLVIQTRLESGKEASPSLGLVDSQTVKTMSFTKEKDDDGNKKRVGRKRFIVTDTLGLLLGLVILPANTGEREGALLVFAKVQNRFREHRKINIPKKIKKKYTLAVWKLYQPQ